jgi:hypothetical protein
MLMGIHACMLAHRVVLEKLLRLLHWDICELRKLGTWNSKLKGNFLRNKFHFGNFQVKSPHVVPVKGTRCFPMQFIMLNRLGMVSDAIHAYGDE